MLMLTLSPAINVRGPPTVAVSVLGYPRVEGRTLNKLLRLCFLLSQWFVILYHSVIKKSLNPCPSLKLAKVPGILGVVCQAIISSS